MGSQEIYNCILPQVQIPILEPRKKKEERKELIIRTLKLRPNKAQEEIMERWLNNLTSIYNWGVRKIELNAQNKIYFSKLEFQNLLANCSKKMNIPSHIMQGTLIQSYNAWKRCFKKLSRKPRLKGNKNKLNSIPFPDPIQYSIGNKIAIPGLKSIRFHKQQIPKAKIKCGRIVKRASGWHLFLFLDYDNKFPVKETKEAVGIDPGFKTLITLSNGIKIENPKELSKGAKRLAQAQRGNDKKLAAKLQEKQANRRNDRNHKISRKLVENYATICFSDDNFKNLAKIHGKSVSEASLGSFLNMLAYKSRIGGRQLIKVNSKFTTMACSNCGALTGPTGWDGLKVRHWVCSACGADHDRDINSAVVVLNAGLGTSLKEGSNVFNKQESPEFINREVQIMEESYVGFNPVLYIQ